MEEPIGFFWHARRSQIYPELARLEEAGLISHTLVEQQDRPDKKVYQITPAGLDTLRRWTIQPPRVQPDRDEFMLKIYSIWLADPREALAMLHARADYHARRLTRYEQIQREMEHEWPPDARRFDSPKFAAYATLQRGIQYERSYADWCHWIARTIEEQLERDSDR